MDFSQAQDIVKLVKTAIRKAVSELGAERALVILPQGDERRPQPLAQFGFSHPDVWNDPEVQTDVLRLVLLSGETFTLPDTRKPSRFSSTTAGRSLLCLALGRGGILYCDHQQPERFGLETTQAAEEMAHLFFQRLKELEPRSEAGPVSAPVATVREHEQELDAGQVSLTLKERHLFTMQLATLVGAGVPLGQGLQALTQTPDPRVAAVAEALAYQVETGSYLSKAMAGLPRSFDHLYVGLIAIAEETGRVAAVMKATADQLERNLLQRARLIEACAYPIFVAGFSFSVAFLLATWMLPQLLGVLEGMDLEMPLLTRLVMGMVKSGLVQQGGLLLFILSLMLYSRRHSPGVRSSLDHLKFHSPLVGRVNRNVSLGRWCRDLALMLDTGFSVVAALRKIGETGTTFEELDRCTRRLEERIAEGFEFGEAIQEEQVLPPLVRSALELGDASGRLTRFLRLAAKHLEEEADRELERLIALIEPLTISALGILVGTVVLAAFLPIYQLLSSSL